MKKTMKTGDTNKHYETCSFEDFLQDNFFVSSMTHPTPETEFFWENAFKEGKLNTYDYRWARNFIDSVQVESEIISGKEKDDLWKRIETSNNNNLKKRENRYRYYFLSLAGIAAALLLVVTVNTLMNKKPEQTQASLRIENIKAPDSLITDIQLVINEEKTISLKDDEYEITYNNNGVAIENRESGVKEEEFQNGKINEYNQLIVPFGKRSALTLTDGSKIWINAGTRVVYPPLFAAKEREIYVDGEIFLEVAPDKNRPFVVKTKNIKAEVLGTSFNINAYENDSLQQVALLSGSIKIHLNENETVLSPSHLFTSFGNTFEVKTVNVNKYISWKDGIYLYESESLSNILKRLARYYGETINYPPEIARMKCSGKLDLKDNLQRILNGIATTAPVHYQFENGKHFITIN